MLLSSSRTTLFVLNCSGLIRFSVIILGLIEKYSVCCEFSSGNSEFAGYSFRKGVGRKGLLWEIYWSPLCLQSFWSLICVIFFVRSGHSEDQPPLQPDQNTISQVHPQVRSAALGSESTQSIHSLQYSLKNQYCWLSHAAEERVPDVTDTK